MVTATAVTYICIWVLIGTYGLCLHIYLMCEDLPARFLSFILYFFVKLWIWFCRCKPIFQNLLKWIIWEFFVIMCHGTWSLEVTFIYHCKVSVLFCFYNCSVNCYIEAPFIWVHLLENISLLMTTQCSPPPAASCACA